MRNFRREGGTGGRFHVFVIAEGSAEGVESFVAWIWDAGIRDGVGRAGRLLA